MRLVPLVARLPWASTAHTHSDPDTATNANANAYMDANTDTDSDPNSEADTIAFAYNVTISERNPKRFALSIPDPNRLSLRVSFAYLESEPER